MINRDNWRDEIRARLIPEMREYGLEVWDGWKDLICDLVDHIEGSTGEKLILFQVKEKFGGLRFYIDSNSTGLVKEFVQSAEDRSWHICEKCGAPGSETVSGGWMKTLCQSCFRVWSEESWQVRMKGNVDKFLEKHYPEN